MVELFIPILSTVT